MLAAASCHATRVDRSLQGTFFFFFFAWVKKWSGQNRTGWTASAGPGYNLAIGLSINFNKNTPLYGHQSYLPTLEQKFCLDTPRTDSSLKRITENLQESTEISHHPLGQTLKHHPWGWRLGVEVRFINGIACCDPKLDLLVLIDYCLCANYFSCMGPDIVSTLPLNWRDKSFSHLCTSWYHGFTAVCAIATKTANS